MGVAINLLGTFYVQHLLDWPFWSFAGHKPGPPQFLERRFLDHPWSWFSTQIRYLLWTHHLLGAVSGIHWPWTLKTTVSGAQHSFSTRKPMNMERAVLFLFVVLRIPESHLVYSCDYLVPCFLQSFPTVTRLFIWLPLLPPSPIDLNRSESPSAKNKAVENQALWKKRPNIARCAMLMCVWAYAFGKPAKYLSYQRMLRDFGLSLARN